METNKAEESSVDRSVLLPAERADLRKQLTGDAKSGWKDPLRSTLAAAALLFDDQLARIADSLVARERRKTDEQ